MIVEVTNKDLHAALSVNLARRGSTNCVLAKAIGRVTGAKKVTVPGIDNVIVDGKMYRQTRTMSKLITMFDNRKYDELRSMLPIRVALLK